MVLWKKILTGVALTALVAGGTFYWRIARSGPSLVSVDPTIKLVEKPCDPAFSAARCGVVIAPLDYSNPNGKTVEVGFVRFPAVGFGSNPTLQLVGGGPGSSITEDMKAGGSAAIIPTRVVLNDRSLLFIEPRGIALSTKLDCAIYKNMKLHPDHPSVKQLCANEIGPDLDYFTTENTAQDFERVRRALGIAELDLYGFSYGTMLSSVYASRFPKHIRTLGLDGALPLTTWAPFMPTHYSGMKRMFQQFCERSNKCKTDEVMLALSWATNELRKAPRPLKTSSKEVRLYVEPLQLDVAALAGLAATMPEPGEDEKTSSPVWRLPFVSALLTAYRKQDWTDLESFAVEKLSIEKKQIDDPGYPSAAALGLTITCQDWTVPWKLTSTIDQRRIEYKANATAYDQANPNAFAPFTAAEWGMRRGSLGYYDGSISCPVRKTALTAQHNQTYTWPDALPVLVLNADYDFQTVNEDAQLAAAQFKKAQFAGFKHHGHAVLPESMCAVKLLREFLDNKRVADPMKCYDADAAGVSLDKGTQK